MSNLPFVEEILADLRRFAECVEDNNDVNLERSRFDLLVQLGLLERVQRSPARWMMTQAGEDAIAQPGDAEPVAWMTRPLKGSHKGREFTCEPDASLNLDLWEKPFPVYTAAPAVAHADESVQYRLLRLGEIIQATDELLRDDCTTWTPMSEGSQLGIGWGWHAGLMPVRRIDAAMRAQGDGEQS